MRKYLRAIARCKMEKMGISRINKSEVKYIDGRRIVCGSYFANHWREVLKEQVG